MKTRRLRVTAWLVLSVLILTACSGATDNKKKEKWIPLVQVMHIDTEELE